MLNIIYFVLRRLIKSNNQDNVTKITNVTCWLFEIKGGFASTYLIVNMLEVYILKNARRIKTYF